MDLLVICTAGTLGLDHVAEPAGTITVSPSTAKFICVCTSAAAGVAARHTVAKLKEGLAMAAKKIHEAGLRDKAIVFWRSRFNMSVMKGAQNIR